MIRSFFRVLSGLVRFGGPEPPPVAHGSAHESAISGPHFRALLAQAMIEPCTLPVSGQSPQLAHGQRLEDLMRILEKNSEKNPSGVKVPTVSHPITKEDLTRRST